MRTILLVVILALASCVADRGLDAHSDNIAAAITDARRTPAEHGRDADRHPSDTLAFARIREGARVGEILPSGGYFTRLLAVAVGNSGRLYPVLRPEGSVGDWEKPALAVAAQYSNVQVVRAEFTSMSFPEPLDVVFTAQNYHDFPIAAYHLGDIDAVNRAVFRALKPGGLYVIIDHSAVAGAPVMTAEDSLHRIDQAIVRRQVEAAGFVYDGESDALRNPADARTLNVFDPGIRFHTDQFMMRFRRPR